MVLPEDIHCGCSDLGYRWLGSGDVGGVMKPTVIRFSPSVKLGEPIEKEDAIIFPRIRERLVDVVNSWRARGYTVSNNLHGRLVVRKASRATFFFNRFRRGVK